jgi:predicted ribosome quality control (RQC) complex YloA/Tae2 family protein
MVKVDNTFENNPIKIGQNSQENDDLVKESKDTDIWSHLAIFPSCHVVIECSEEFPLDNIMIHYCSQIVKQNTKYRNVPKLKVNYTKIKNIQRTEQLGCVIMKGKFYTITI